MPTGGRSIPAAFLQEETFPWPFTKLEDVVLGVEMGETLTLGQGWLNFVSQGQPWGAPELGRAWGVSPHAATAEPTCSGARGPQLESPLTTTGESAYLDERPM